MKIIERKADVASFCRISTLVVFDLGKRVPVEPENFCLAGQVCRSIANFYITNGRPDTIKDIGATFFGLEFDGTVVISFHIVVDQGLAAEQKKTHFTANLSVDSGDIIIMTKDKEDRFSYQVAVRDVDAIARIIIRHIEQEREKKSNLLFKVLGERLESEATFKLILDGEQQAVASVKHT